MHSSSSSPTSSLIAASPTASSPMSAVTPVPRDTSRTQTPAVVSDSGPRLNDDSDTGDAAATHEPLQAVGGDGEGYGDVYDATLWAKILEDDSHMELEGEDSEQKQQYVATTGGSETPATVLQLSNIHARGAMPSLECDMKTEPSTPPHVFDHWSHYDPEMTGAVMESAAMTDFSSATPAPPPSSSASTVSTSSVASGLYLPSTNLSPVYDEFHQSMDTSFMSGASLSSLLGSHHQPFASFANPTQTLSFEPQPNGEPFPLSKPIIREDGILLVGTEMVAQLGTANTRVKNRIFVTNFLRSTHPVQIPSHFLVEEEVRDMHWVNARAAIVAVGKEIQLIQVGDPSGSGSCRVQDPINTIHSDTIRELAVSPTMSSLVLSGGFDETVVLSDLGSQGDPTAASIVTKFDAYDVVSSVRWAPTESQLSWTTDGGDFQVADIRVRSAQLQIPLSAFLHVNSMGGLFAHEYLSNFTIALGFERGHLAFVDTRMPRETSSYSAITSPLAAVGEIRRAKSKKVAVFGLGGFATADINLTANSLQQITLRQQPQHMAQDSYKTSGAFSFERGAYLAVSDSMGVVSVYTDDALLATSSAFGGGGTNWRL